MPRFKRHRVTPLALSTNAGLASNPSMSSIQSQTFHLRSIFHFWITDLHIPQWTTNMPSDTHHQHPQIWDHGWWRQRGLEDPRSLVHLLLCWRRRVQGGWGVGGWATHFFSTATLCSEPSLCFCKLRWWRRTSLTRWGGSPSSGRDSSRRPSLTLITLGSREFGLSWKRFTFIFFFADSPWTLTYVARPPSSERLSSSTTCSLRRRPTTRTTGQAWCPRRGLSSKFSAP